MRERVLQHLDRHADHVVDLLQRLVRIPTVNPPGDGYEACARLLADELRRLGLKTELLRVPPARQRRLLPGSDAYPRFNVIARWDTGAAATLHFNCHYDVVPASPEGWISPPFEPAVRGGKIFGRGVADMKGAIAAVCYALAGLKAAQATPRCNLEVSFTADEETDSACGADWIASRGKLKATHVIVGEGGSGPAICCGHNGCLWFHVKVQGRAAHGSNPEQGINAFEKMSALVMELQRYQRRIAARSFRAPDGKLMRPTVNFGGVFGGDAGGKVNSVPGFATFTVDRRILPNEDARRAEAEFRRAVHSAARRIPQLNVEVERFTYSNSLYTPPGNPLFRALARSIRRVRGTSARPYVATGFNDMHFFNHHLGVPVVGYGPLGTKYHAANEQAPIADLVKTAKVYADLALSFEGSEESGRTARAERT